jgi:hypothetical protein
MDPTYIVRRTGRRNRPVLLELESGEKVRINGSGSHVLELTDADVAMLSKLPGTVVTLSRSCVRAAPEPEPEKPKAKSRRKKKASKG